MATNISDAFKFQEQQDYLTENFVNFITTTSFTSGTTKTSDTGFENAKVGTIIIVTGDSASVSIVTAVNSSTKVITATAI